MTDADRFLLFRRGLEGPMTTEWRIPGSAVEGGLTNVRGDAQHRTVRGRLGTLRRGSGLPVDLLTPEPPEP